MKHTESPEQTQDILTEYNFDYSEAKPNRFVTQVIVTLDPDVAQVFKTSKAVNEALRAILTK